MKCMGTGEKKCSLVLVPEPDPATDEDEIETDRDFLFCSGDAPFKKIVDFAYISEESSELLFQQPANDGVEIFVDELPTVTKENRELRKTDFVTLNDGNLLTKEMSFYYEMSLSSGL